MDRTPDRRGAKHSTLSRVGRAEHVESDNAELLCPKGHARRFGITSYRSGLHPFAAHTPKRAPHLVGR